MTSRRLPIVCRKTSLCKFNLKGCCTKGPRCNFAHSSVEVKTAPDLACTRLCETMISSGYCGDPECKFAHNKDELRSFPSRAQCGQPPPSPFHAGSPQKPADAATPLKVFLSLDSATKEAADSDTASTYAPDTFTEYTWSRQVSDEASDDEFIPEETLEEVLEEEPEGSSRDAGPTLLDIDTPPNMKLMHKLRKTKMCIFYAEGTCKKGHKCNFAHNEEDLKPKPELTRTKICPGLLKHGKCTDSGCLYAHSQDELQSVGDEEHAAAAATFSCLQQPQSSRQDGVLPLLPFRIPANSIDVKNTFIQFFTTEEEEDRAIALHFRGRSAPAVLVRENTKALHGVQLPLQPSNDTGTSMDV